MRLSSRLCPRLATPQHPTFNGTATDISFVHLGSVRIAVAQDAKGTSLFEVRGINTSSPQSEPMPRVEMKEEAMSVFYGVYMVHRPSGKDGLVPAPGAIGVPA